jgi:FeS assembly protein IscX
LDCLEELSALSFRAERGICFFCSRDGEVNPACATLKETTMPDKFDWNDTEDIAIQLADKFPDTDPLSVRFTDLHKWVTELEAFGGDPSGSNEGKLEAIQMAWHEEYQDRQED